MFITNCIVFLWSIFGIRIVLFLNFWCCCFIKFTRKWNVKLIQIECYIWFLFLLGDNSWQSQNLQTWFRSKPSFVTAKKKFSQQIIKPATLQPFVEAPPTTKLTFLSTQLNHFSYWLQMIFGTFYFSWSLCGFWCDLTCDMPPQSILNDLPETYLEPSRTTTMELLKKFKCLTGF